MTMPNPTRSMKTVVKMTTRGERFMGFSILDFPIFYLDFWSEEFPGLELQSKIGNRQSRTSHFLRPPERVNARSMEAAPPPEIIKENAIAKHASGYSIPRLFAKKLGQWI